MPYYVEDEDEQGRRRLTPVPTEKEKRASWLLLGLLVAAFLAVVWMAAQTLH